MQADSTLFYMYLISVKVLCSTIALELLARQPDAPIGASVAVLISRKGEAVHRTPLQRFVGVEVLPRGFDVAVAHELLDGHDVAAAFEEPCRVGVPEFVERGVGHFGGGNFLQRAQERVCRPPRLVGNSLPAWRALFLGDELADKLVPFAALRVGWGAPGELAASPLPLPPFEKVVAGAFIPHVAGADAQEGDKFPDAAPLLDLLDDADFSAGLHGAVTGQPR